MTIEEAQAELLRLVGRNGGGGALQQLGTGLAGGVAQRGLLADILPLGNTGLTSGSLLTGALAGAAPVGSGGLGGSLVGLSPGLGLLSGLLRGLVGRGTPAPLPELPKYEAPQSISLDLGLSDGGRSLGRTSYGQTGAPRVQAITVNVSAMDSRSFVDNSEQIAMAVRQAMLNSGALVDVVSEI
jgi:hypothetical protein